MNYVKSNPTPVAVAPKQVDRLVNAEQFPPQSRLWA